MAEKKSGVGKPRLLKGKKNLLAHNCYDVCCLSTNMLLFFVFNFDYLFFEEFINIHNVFGPYSLYTPPRSPSSPSQLQIFFFTAY